MMDKNEIIHIAEGLISSGILTLLIRWMLRRKRKGYTHIITVQSDDGTIIEYATDETGAYDADRALEIIDKLRELEESDEDIAHIQYQMIRDERIDGDPGGA